MVRNMRKGTLPKDTIDRPMRTFVMLAAIATGTAICPAAANPLKSLYTTIDLKACKQTQRHKDGGTWICDGLPGYPIYVAEGDLRSFVSAGPRPEARRAASQTLGPFNSIFERGSNRATVEWRFIRRGERQIPYATIVRFHTSRERRRGDVLVISKIGASESCHVAYVDALANEDAIALARRIADSKARSFDCRNEPHSEGETGRSPM
jgi:hypothetical protein